MCYKVREMFAGEKLTFLSPEPSQILKLLQDPTAYQKIEGSGNEDVSTPTPSAPILYSGSFASDWSPGETGEFVLKKNLIGCSVTTRNPAVTKFQYSATRLIRTPRGHAKLYLLTGVRIKRVNFRENV